MKNAKEIKNGSLYFNTALDRVERAIGKVNSGRVWTTRHENQAQAVRVKNLRLAEKNEVENYIQESESLAGAVPMRALPPLPV
jgi:uncharacterized DUF497 family protein